MLKKIINVFRQLYHLNNMANTIHRQWRLESGQAFEALKNNPRYRNPKALGGFGAKSYSQNDEDGIIAEIFNRIGSTNKTFVEFGVGLGLESNAFNLLLKGWNGLWIEGSPDYCQSIRKGLTKTLASGQLKLENSFIVVENINDLIAKHIKDKEIDLLSVDIDGNDYHIWNAINCINPRVVIFEYNAKILPDVSWCMAYKPDYAWDGSDTFGASLKFLEEKLDARGYALVGCNLTGVNAFFIRKDLLQDYFLAPYTAENHYEPPRYYLSSLQYGHPSSYNILENKHI